MSYMTQNEKLRIVKRNSYWFILSTSEFVPCTLFSTAIYVAKHWDYNWTTRENIHATFSFNEEMKEFRNDN
jgi:hypothetical protein